MSPGTPQQTVRAAPPPRWPAIADLIRLRNQTGTLLLLLPTLWALVIASHGRPSVRLLAIFSAGAFLMRSAGVILNDLADRTIDRQVPRTASRPLASGRLHAGEAVAGLLLLLAAAAGLLVLLPPIVRWLSPVAVLTAALYPYAKRVMPLPQAVLGLAFGWGVVMAWAAATGGLAGPVWLLYAAALCWAVAYDTVYAVQDREADARLGVHSAAVLFGRQAWLAVAVALALMLGALAAIGAWTGAGPAFYAGLTAVAIVEAREVWAVRRGLEGAEAFAWFKRQVWIGGAILAAFWAGLANGR